MLGQSWSSLASQNLSRNTRSAGLHSAEPTEAASQRVTVNHNNSEQNAQGGQRSAVRESGARRKAAAENVHGTQSARQKRAGKRAVSPGAAQALPTGPARWDTAPGNTNDLHTICGAAGAAAAECPEDRCTAAALRALVLRDPRTRGTPAAAYAALLPPSLATAALSTAVAASRPRASRGGAAVSRQTAAQPQLHTQACTARAGACPRPLTSVCGPRLKPMFLLR